MVEIAGVRPNARALAGRLAFGVSAIGFGQSAFIALVPLIAVQTGLGTGEIGMAAALGALAFVAGAPICGSLGARFGHGRTLCALGLVVLCGQLLLAGLIWTTALAPLLALAVLITSRLVYGFGASGVIPVAQSWVCRSAAEEQHRGLLALLSAGLGTGRILGSVAAMTASLAAQLPFLLLVLSPISLLFVPREKRLSPALDTDEKKRLFPFDRRILPFLAIGFCLMVGFGQVQMMLGPILEAKLGLTASSATSATGLILTLVAAAMILVQVFAIPRLPFDQGIGVTTGSILLALGALTVVASGGFALCAVGLVIGGIGVAIASPTYLAWLVSRVQPREQGAAAGWLASAHVLGQGAGAVIGGYAFALWPPLPLLFCAAPAGAIAVAAWSIKPGRS
ncbi:MFS transporter [Chelativorans sp. YIM 93263]|uniref:MFS transporter n=1 Tax=Chelativorans sp. YIM 93263 TaxID=2906648 RepID=UPI0023781204|nr:MFS transporter [Chelativorans sp. YIM 93263]